MALTAIVLAGMPARALAATRQRLRDRFPDYIVRGAAAPERSGRLTRYDVSEIMKVLDQAVEAVFGTSDRPLGFCKNAQRGCENKVASGRSCERTGTQACTLLKPRRLFMLAQEGELIEELMRRFAHAVLPEVVPSALYNNGDATGQFCEAAVSRLEQRACAIERKLDFGSPLLLPPTAFGRSGAVREMLIRVAAGADPLAETRAFRQAYYDRPRKAFVGRSDLAFRPASDSGLHGGTIRPQTDPALALSRRYRLGCEYNGEYHWDVSAGDGSHLNGNYSFRCRQAGLSRPSGKYANVLVDDCLR